MDIASEYCNSKILHHSKAANLFKPKFPNQDESLLNSENFDLTPIERAPDLTNPVGWVERSETQRSRVRWARYA